nr:hypothetical protein Iba_chr12dCG14370 [Ipomoea batatas]
MIEVIGVISGKLGCHDYTECVVCEGGNGHGFAARLEFCKKDSPSFLGSHEAYCSLCTEPDEHKGGKQLRDFFNQLALALLVLQPVGFCNCSQIILLRFDLTLPLFSFTPYGLKLLEILYLVSLFMLPEITPAPSPQFPSDLQKTVYFSSVNLQSLSSAWYVLPRAFGQQNYSLSSGNENQTVQPPTQIASA